MEHQPVALVTGVSSGIGRATAELLAGRGFTVFGTRRSAATSVGLGNVELLSLDVRNDESVRTCVAAVLARARRIDALINNAGYALIGSAEETSLEEAKQLFETNFFGVLRMTQAVLPLMRQQGSGRIAVIGSVVGFLPGPYESIYSASKHALEGYIESLDYEVRQFGIRAAIIEPGFIRTNIAESSQMAARRIEAYARDRDHVVSAIHNSVTNGEDPNRVAAVVYEALTSRSPRIRYPAGQQAKFLRRVRRFAPSRILERGLRKQFQLEV
jgi:short-subunit dehydrogenase